MFSVISNNSLLANWNQRNASQVTSLKFKQLEELGSLSIYNSDYPTFYCQFNHDGSRILVANEEGIIAICCTELDFNNAGPTPLNCFDAHKNAIFEAKWNNDSTRIITGSADATMKLFDSSTLQTVSEFKGHGSSIKTVSFHHAQPELVVSGCRQGTVKLWDLRIPQAVPIWTIENAHYMQTNVRSRRVSYFNTVLDSI
jgi:WD40 repeat protein